MKIRGQQVNMTGFTGGGRDCHMKIRGQQANMTGFTGGGGEGEARQDHPILHIDKEKVDKKAPCSCIFFYQEPSKTNSDFFLHFEFVRELY